MTPFCLITHCFLSTCFINYLQSTGDTETVGELWPTARRQIELALTRCDSQGLVRDSDDWWVFIDWQAELNKQRRRRGCSSTVCRELLRR